MSPIRFSLSLSLAFVLNGDCVPVLRNPLLFVFLLCAAGGTYVMYNMNLLGPMMQMANAASHQGIELAKDKLREFVENSDAARQALNMPARENSDAISMETLDSRGKRKEKPVEDVDDM